MTVTEDQHDGRLFCIPAVPLLVFTDLDGTLLDHHDYSYTAAQPALQRLKQLNVPLIPTTSKTLTEVSALQRSLDNRHPCIVENGGALCIPRGYFAPDALDPPPRPDTEPYLVEHLGPSYTLVVKILHELRARFGWRFSGFADMSVTEVTRHTGLATVDAARARQRLCSEPLLWQDTDEALTEFARQIENNGLTLTRGGRFWHVMGRTSKAKALRRLSDRYRDAGLAGFTTVACGDSPNDEEMLASADIAVVVRRPDGQWLDVAGRQQTLKTNDPGPAGWNAALQQILDRLAHPSAVPTEA